MSAGLTRRRFLRATGVMLPLPALESSQSRAFGAGNSVPPRRMACICTQQPSGVVRMVGSEMRGQLEKAWIAGRLREFSNVDEFKQPLLAETGTFARALTVNLLTYATRGLAEATDQREVTSILERAKAKQWGFRSLLHEIIQSRLFLEK